MSGSAAGPPTVRFSQVLRRLNEAGDSRGVIRLVERWSEHGGVTQAARMAEARAFMDLCLMDRAGVRLGEAAEAEPESLDVQLLTVKLYIERGWPGRARQMLARLEGADATAIERLREDAAKPPREVPKNASDIERTGTAEQVLGLAESYLVTGSVVRAESLLERLVRDGFTPPRVSDLLWAVRGEFGSQRLSTEALMDELAGDEWANEWGGQEHTESSSNIEETAHVDPRVLDEQLLSAADQQAFPALFRRDEASGEVTDGDDAEVTMSSMMTNEETSVSTGILTDPDVTPGLGFGDTKIMEVITRGDGVAIKAAEGPLHRPSKGPLPSTLDLRAHQEDTSPNAAPFLEDEDKDLIVMTRREQRASHKPATRSTPVEVLKRTEPERPALGSREVEKLTDRVQREASQLPQESSPIDVSEPDPDTDDVIAGVRNKRSRWVHMGTPMGVVVVVAVVSIWAMVSVVYWIAAKQIIQETHQTIAAGDFRALQELEAKLEGQMKANRSLFEVRQIELALAKTMLWAEFTGDFARMHAAQDVVEQARAMGAPEDEIALVNGYLRLAMGDLETARKMVDQLDMDDPLHRDLTARVALRVRGDEESRALMTRFSPTDEDTPLLELLSREALLTALDDVDEAVELRERLLNEHANSPFVQIARFHEQWDDETNVELLPLLSDVMESLPGPVSPRQEGRLHAQRAMLLMERGNRKLAQQSWAAALIVDPSHPRYLFVAASERLANNEVGSALDDLDRCMGARPWDYRCRRGMIQALIELDRLETARQSVEAWKSGRTTVLEAWVSLAEGKEEEALALVEDQGSTLAAWVRGMALKRLGSDKASATLGLVIEGWSDIQEPMTQMLVGRARIAKALADLPAHLVEPMVVEWAPTDPFIYVEMARAWEASGQRSSAAWNYQKAVELGPENALALHALGMFWFDPRNHMDDARAIWQRYLDLQPNGDRARRTRARMGRR